MFVCLTSSREVRTAMVDLNSKLQTRGAAVVQAARRQRTLQLAQQQLQQQAATIRNCRALVALAQRAASQVAAKRYVAAMHSLAAIEAQVCDPLSMPDRATSSATSAAGLASSVNTVSMTQAGSSPAAARSGGHVEPAQLQQEELEEDQELLQQRALAETPLAQSLRAWLPGAQRAALQDTKRGLAEWLAVARPRARRMGATLRSRVLCLEASELAHLLSGPTTPWTDASSSSNNKHHSDSSNKDSLGSSSGSNTETVALLAALSEVEATSREVLAVTTSANTQTAAGAGRDEDKKETATDNSTSTVVADASNTPSDLSAAVAAGNQAMARLRTARVAALEASLGLAAWDNLGHAEPCLRSLLAHAALPRHSWPSSPPVETSAEDQAQAVKKPTATGSATDGSIDENSGKHDGPATTPPASSEVVSLEHSKEGAAAVMAEVRRSLAPLDQAVAVHAARGSKPLAEFRAQYEALRSPHFLPKQLLELHRAQDGPTPPAPRRISQASPEASFSSSSSSSGGRGDGCGGTPDDLSQSAWQEWCGSVAAWPDLLDTLGGFFAMECTLCALTSVPQATFTREDLASLWRDATDELIELLLERFHTFDQKMHAHSLPTLPRPGDRTTSTTSAAATADGMVALQRDPLMGLLLLKECCLGFNASLGSRTYGFSSKPLRRALGQKVLPKFLATQLRAVEVRCARAAALDGHQPWSVSNDTVYAQWVEPLALDRLLVDQSTAEGGHGVTSSSHQNSAGRVEFPVQFSFSAAVPHVGLILHRFLAQSLAFCHGLGPDSALSGGDGDDDDDDDDDDEVNGVNNATGVVGNGNSSGGSNGCKNRGALLRHALAEALFSVDNTLNNLLTNNDSTKADRSSSGGNSSGKGNLDASSHASKRSRLGMASSKKDTNSSSRSGGSNSSSGGNQAVSISLAAQVSLDARAYAALAYQLGALLNHALSSSGWPDARSSDVNGYNSGLSVASNAGADDFNHREDNHHPRNGGGGGARTIANAAKSLQATADRAQDLIFELVRLKCDELLSLDAINWEPTAAPDGPRPEVVTCNDLFRVPLRQDPIGGSSPLSEVLEQ